MIRPLRLLGEYFLGTETNRWYSNQRVVAREHLPDGQKLDGYHWSSVFDQAIHLNIGRLLPNMILAASLYNISNPKMGYVLAFGEIIRMGEMIFHRGFRTPFLQSGYAKPEEPETWEAEDGEGWKVEKPNSWEDEGEEWKN